MAHLTLQLGGPLVVPFRVHFGRRQRRDTQSWKIRSLREASATDAGLPVRQACLPRLRTACGRLHPVAGDGDACERNGA